MEYHHLISKVETKSPAWTFFGLPANEHGVIFNQGRRQWGGPGGPGPPRRAYLAPPSGKISIFVGENLLHLKFCTVTLIFAVTLSSKNLDSPQKKRNHLSIALCNWLGIKVVKTFTMNELPQLLCHFMLSTEGKSEVTDKYYLQINTYLWVRFPRSIMGLRISAFVGEKVCPQVVQKVAPSSVNCGNYWEMVSWHASIELTEAEEF